MDHPDWCIPANCTADRPGGHHKGAHSSVQADGREVLRVWLEAGNGDPAHVVMSAPQAQQVLDMEVLAQCTSLLAAMTAELIGTNRGR